MDEHTVETLGTTGAFIARSIVLGALIAWSVFGANEIRKEIRTWRSMKGMRYSHLSIDCEDLKERIIENFSRQDITIDPFDVPKWKKQLHLTHSYQIRYGSDNAYLLIGDYSEKGKKPDVAVFIGPFAEEQQELRTIIERSIDPNNTQ
jgi:hypothetical protein